MQTFLYLIAGFPPGMFESFQFKCSQCPILIDMTAKYGIYFYFLCQQEGDIPPVVQSVCGGGESPDPPPQSVREGGPDPPPLTETLYCHI